MKNIAAIFYNPLSTPDTISQTGEKMFLAIYKVPADEYNLNKRRYEHFSNHQPRSKLIFPQFLQSKERRSNTLSAMCFYFGTFDGTCTKGIPLEEEEAFELDHILEKHSEI
ncbi:hypothetical protein AVEN_84035-1 [Araneus ventricosus]|uniref:Uncharacterized protein n=1 Tax=Araneus ventricosus TaxID=182803 RepID=A0A4Y2UH79_ARAVE|nr:hypothetical protein AVEN_84035-1 [Araneus ventricosus]